MGKAMPKGLPESEGSHELRLRLDSFAWQELRDESQRLGVSVEELANFSLLYYLADLDSGRIARRVPAPSRSRAC